MKQYKHVLVLLLSFNLVNMMGGAAIHQLKTKCGTVSECLCQKRNEKMKVTTNTKHMLGRIVGCFYFFISVKVSMQLSR